MNNRFICIYTREELTLLGEKRQGCEEVRLQQRKAPGQTTGDSQLIKSSTVANFICPKPTTHLTIYLLSSRIIYKTRWETVERHSITYLDLLLKTLCTRCRKKPKRYFQIVLNLISAICSASKNTIVEEFGD